MSRPVSEEPPPPTRPTCEACKAPRKATLWPWPVKGRRVYLCGRCRIQFERKQ